MLHTDPALDRSSIALFINAELVHADTLIKVLGRGSRPKLRTWSMPRRSVLREKLTRDMIKTKLLLSKPSDVAL